MIALLGQVFAGIWFVVSFIKKFLLKYATFAVVLSLQFTITASTIAFVLFFYGFTITVFISLYNKVFEIVDYISSYNAPGVSQFFGFLDCIGVLPALQSGFTYFYTALGTVMMFHLIRFTFGALSAVKDEIFKLGVLLGQAL